MIPSLAESLRAMQDPTRRQGADLRPVIAVLQSLSHFALSQRRVNSNDRDDLVQECLLALLETRAPFRQGSDGEARAYLWRTLDNRAIDKIRHNKREHRRRSAFELRCVGVARSSNERAVVMAIELREAVAKTARALHDRGVERALIGHLNALGMLEWTAPAKMDDSELAESLGTTPNALQARRSRVRKAVASITEQLVRQGVMDESERNAMLALVAPR
jgi:DNA-directed RNA polymerase specialized sigma24 family protein